MQKEKEEQTKKVKDLTEEMKKCKDNQIVEQKNLVDEMKSTLELHSKLVFYSTDEDRRCLGEYEKLSEEKIEKEYKTLIKEGVLKEADISCNVPIFKQKDGTYKLLREGFIWKVGGKSVSYSAESSAPFPPTTGWKDENGQHIPTITVALSATIPCR